MLLGEPILVSVLCVLALSALVRSTFGFADALLAIPLGRWLNRRLPPGNFGQLVYLLLLAVAGMLLLNTYGPLLRDWLSDSTAGHPTGP